MTQKVSRALITVVQMVPRLALQITPRQLKELEVSELLMLSFKTGAAGFCCLAGLCNVIKLVATLKGALLQPQTALRGCVP